MPNFAMKQIARPALVIMILASLACHLWQNHRLREKIDFESIMKHEVLVAATESLKRHYKEDTGEDLNPDLLDHFKAKITFDRDRKRWNVDFIHVSPDFGSIRGPTSTASFLVDQNFTASYRSLRIGNGP